MKLMTEDERDRKVADCYTAARKLATTERQEKSKCPLLNDHCDDEFCNGSTTSFIEHDCKDKIPKVLSSGEMNEIKSQWDKWVGKCYPSKKD